MSKLTSETNEVKNDLRSQFSDTAKDVTERAREVASSAADSTIGFAKKYPIHTAIGALGVGCVVGFLARKPK